MLHSFQFSNGIFHSIWSPQAPLPPDEIIVDVRDEPQYWIFCRPEDFLATDIATVFIEPEPSFFSETVVVNETFVPRDRGFAVNPGIEPSLVAAAIGRPVPEFQVRPHVLAGTAAALPGAMQVSAQDLRRTDFRSESRAANKYPRDQ